MPGYYLSMQYIWCRCSWNFAAKASLQRGILHTGETVALKFTAHFCVHRFVTSRALFRSTWLPATRLTLSTHLQPIASWSFANLSICRVIFNMRAMNFLFFVSRQNATWKLVCHALPYLQKYCIAFWVVHAFQCELFSASWSQTWFTVYSQYSLHKLTN